MKTYLQVEQELSEVKSINRTTAEILLMKDNDLFKKVLELADVSKKLIKDGFKLDSDNPSKNDIIRMPELKNITAPIENNKFSNIFEIRLQSGKVGLTISLTKKEVQIEWSINDRNVQFIKTKNLKDSFK